MTEQGAVLGDADGQSSRVKDVTWAHRTAWEIWRRLASSEYAGWDPYDALNSRLLPRKLIRSRTLARVALQAVKRSPLPLQPILRVKPEVDAYTLGHVLVAAARLASRSGPETKAELKEAAAAIVTQLKRTSWNDSGRIGWGYHFPMQSRFSFYGPPYPNIIVTAFVSKGLAAVTRAGLVDCSPLLESVAEFVLTDLPRTTDTSGQCVKYHFGATPIVHNANMLAAMLLCDAAEPSGNARTTDAVSTSWIEEALACARFTVARQRVDGSWPYADDGGGEWVDGFHTGFVLEGLARVVHATGDPDLRASLDLGTQYYVAQLFGPEGEPKYYPHRPWPYDALSAAQGIETLQVVLGANAAQAVPGQISWIRDHVVRDGKVAFQVHRRWTDWRDFPRWASAPMMSALSGVENTSQTAETEGD